MDKKATLLISDVIFLVLAVSFIAILIVFIAKQSSNYRVIEEEKAKEIALMIDAAEPGTQITYYIGDLIKKKTERFGESIVFINGEDNFVRVTLSEKSGNSYGFFNDLNIESEIKGEYLIIKIK